MKTNILWKLAGSLWILIFSSLTFNKIGEVSLSGLFVMPETLIFLIFGIFHALLVLIGRETVNNHFQVKENLSEKLLGFLSDTILYSSFYRLVLLPSCGFGFIEWALLLLFFAQEFGIHFHIKRQKKDDTLDEKKLISFDEEKIFDCGKERFVNPFQLTILGLVLWGFKIIIRYFLPQNLYQSLSGNKTVLNIILILVALLGIYGIRRLFFLATQGKKRDSKKSVSAAVTKRTIKIAFSAIFKTLKTLGSAIVSAIGGPALIVVVIVIFVAFGLVAFFFINRARQDMLLFIGRILSHVLSTDNAGYTETTLNTVGQCISLVIFFVVQIMENYFSEKNIQNTLEEKWFETVKNAKSLPDKNRPAIQQILRKQILRKDLPSSTKQKSYELLTKEMNEEEKSETNSALIKDLLENF